MFRLYHAAVTIAAAGMLLFSGCRTYGGYETKPKTYQALQETVQSFEEDLSQATSDVEKLETAAEEADTLQRFVEEYQSFIEEHKSVLQKQRRRVDRLSPESTYRNLHAAYGATVTERRMMTRKYQHVIRQVRAVVRGVPMVASGGDKNRQYTIRPVNFPDSDGRKQVTMEQALQGL